MSAKWLWRRICYCMLHQEFTVTQMAAPKRLNVLFIGSCCKLLDDN